mgnify:CR=1 FL=1
MNSQLIFLKLGGSLITDKRQPETPRLDIIRQVAATIAAALRRDRSLRLLIGHGSGIPPGAPATVAAGTVVKPTIATAAAQAEN